MKPAALWVHLIAAHVTSTTSIKPQRQSTLLESRRPPSQGGLAAASFRMLIETFSFAAVATLLPLIQLLLPLRFYTVVILLWSASPSTLEAGRFVHELER